MSDDAAFAAFVREHSRSLFGTAYLLTGETHRAEELLQDTLTRLYPKWNRVLAAQSQVAYVRRSLANRFISVGRSPAARDVAMWTLPDGPTAGDLAETIANRQLIWELLGTLPERQRAALVMRYFHDLPDEEIAAALECRAATVRSLLSRGVAAMRAKSAGADQSFVHGMRGDR
jgi:RNA polymerase sigma-70 factor (sigma-E family)